MPPRLPTPRQPRIKIPISKNNTLTLHRPANIPLRTARERIHASQHPRPSQALVLCVLHRVGHGDQKSLAVLKGREDHSLATGGVTTDGVVVEIVVAVDVAAEAWLYR